MLIQAWPTRPTRTVCDAVFCSVPSLKQDTYQAQRPRSGDSRTVLEFSFWSYMRTHPQQLRAWCLCGTLRKLSIIKEKKKKKADRKVNTTPIQDSNHFWLSQGISISPWFESFLLAHTHWIDSRGILWQCSSPGGFRTELHQVLEWIF